MTTFAADWAAIQKLTEQKMRLAAQQALQVVYNEMSSGGEHSRGTPVGLPKTWKHKPPPDYVPGFARSNWAFGLGAPSEASPGQPGGTVADLSGAIATLDLGKAAFITNNAPYIRRLEFDGWSEQAPDGFVEPAARAFPQIVDEVVAHLAAK